jgi:hypothetical protein
MEVQSYSSDTDFENIQKEDNTLSEACTTQFECKLCEKRYKRKSTLTKHMTTIHEKNKIDKLKLEKETLELKIKLYSDQVRFVKRLILIQEHTVGYRPTSVFNTTNTIPQLPHSINNK